MQKVYIIHKNNHVFHYTFSVKRSTIIFVTVLLDSVKVPAMENKGTCLNLDTLWEVNIKRMNIYVTRDFLKYIQIYVSNRKITKQKVSTMPDLQTNHRIKIGWQMWIDIQQASGYSTAPNTGRSDETKLTRGILHRVLSGLTPRS